MGNVATGNKLHLSSHLMGY